MSFSSGVFSINSAGQPVVTGTVISSTTFNTLTADLASGLSTCLLKDGTQTVTANIPMSGYKITGLGAATANGDALRYEQAGIKLATEQASTSGTSIDFTGIPAGTKRITIMFNEVSTNGTDLILIQLGDAGGIETSGYIASAGSIANAGASVVDQIITGFGFSSVAATNNSGSIVLSLENSSAFTWVANGTIVSTDMMKFIAGRKSTSAELDRVRITTYNGTNTFDAGAINISYE